MAGGKCIDNVPVIGKLNLHPSTLDQLNFIRKSQNGFTIFYKRNTINNNSSIPASVCSTVYSCWYCILYNHLLFHEHY